MIKIGNVMEYFKKCRKTKKIKQYPNALKEKQNSLKLLTEHAKLNKSMNEFTHYKYWFYLKRPQTQRNKPNLASTL